MDIRWAADRDKEALSRLWLTCFGDDQTFRDWFFENRFWPQYCLTACEKGSPVAAVYGLPTRLWVRQRVVPAVIIGGVSTHPQYRGKGLMHLVFADFMAEMHRRGVPLTFLHPVREDLYFKLGHYTCSDRGFYTLHADAPRPPMPRGVVPLEPGQHTEALHRCYQQYILPYSGPVWRKEKDWLFKADDYAAGGARLIAAFDQSNSLAGYCWYFADEQSVMGEECAALSPEAYGRLTAALANLAAGLELTVKLPWDRLPQTEGAHAEVKPWGCMGAGHLPTLLGLLGVEAEGISIGVADPTVPQNTGVYSLKGLPSSLPPAVSLEAGRLVQWLSGYRSLAALAAEGNAAIHDVAAAQKLDDLLPTQNCLCTEEY